MYVKAPKAVIDYLAAAGYDHTLDRQTFGDGTYLLWDRDFLPLCRSEEVEAKLPGFGCVVLTAQQVRALQDGAEPGPMPAITDPALLAFLGEEPSEISENSDQDEEGGDAV